MDVLYLCHRIPYPPDKGDKIRSHALLRQMSKSHRVHLACFVDEPDDFAWCDAVRDIARGECLFMPLPNAKKWLGAARAYLTGQSVTTSFLENRTVREWIAALCSKHHIGCTVVFSSGMASYVLKHSPLDPACSILDMVDVDSDKWRQYADVLSGPRAWIFRREAGKLAQLERLAAKQFGATLLVSDHEATSFAAMAPESASRIFALKNGVDLAYFAPASLPYPFPPGGPPIVMTGRMDYRANINAVEWFVREVMPRLKIQLPSVQFYAVGANPPRSWRHSPEFVAVGQVPDIRPYILHARAIVAPLKIARGVQNKILEAMAMAKSVVATHEATRGLEATPGIDLLVADDPASFASAVVSAISRTDLGQNARHYVEERHNWDRNLAYLDGHLARIGAESIGAKRVLGNAAEDADWTSAPADRSPIAEPAR